MKIGITIGLALVALVVAIVAIGYFEHPNLDSTIQPITGKQIAKTNHQSIEEASATAPTERTVKQEKEAETKQTISVNEKAAIFNEEFSLSEFPAVKTASFEIGRYRVFFETDYTIQFVMYSEQRYNEWKLTGMHTISKITTKEGTSCCRDSGNYVIDINDGEAGEYYFVFDASKTSGKPTKGKIVVEKISDL